jgi:hypothetical protein
MVTTQSDIMNTEIEQPDQESDDDRSEAVGVVHLGGTTEFPQLYDHSDAAGRTRYLAAINEVLNGIGLASDRR